MSNQNNSFNTDRNLVDVFKELQQKRENDTYTYQKNNSKDNNSGITTYFSSNKKVTNPYSYGKKIKRQKVINSTKTFNYTKLSVVIILITLIVSVALLFVSYSFTTYGLEEEVASAPAEMTEFESNQNALDITQIIASNIDMSTIKETLNEEREIKFPIKYQSVDNLPKGEEKVVQEGSNGTNKIVAVRTYENNELIDENVIESKVVKEPVEQLVNIGTSEFLSKYKVHLGDIMYVVSDTDLKESADDKSKTLTKIPSTLDVKLLELSGDWCKVTYDDKTGFVKKTILTSASEAPEMVDKARIQRILRDVKIDMPLNKKSGLSSYDYQVMLSGLSGDTEKVIEKNYQVFFEAEQKYNINGVFLAAIAIHESNYGTSQIAKEKSNYYGWGAYDRSPYESALEFSNLKEATEDVAQGLVLHYLNPKDTEVFEHKKAVGEYYDQNFGPTVEGVNQKYASDKEWHTKVFNHMETLYNKLK